MKKNKYILIIVCTVFFLATPQLALAEGGFFQRLFGGKSSSEVKKENIPAPSQVTDKSFPQYSPATPHDDMNGVNGVNGEAEENVNQDIMEGALSLLEESQIRWARGDIEGAVRILDQAYGLVLNTPDSDASIAREKDELRLLISRRILAVYSSTRQPRAAGEHSEIPLIMNDDVAREIRSFQTVERNFFLSSYRRSGLFRPMIVAELKKAGLPEELSWLPLVESGFKSTALSKARALGLWQFIPSTGHMYGMNRDEWIDERMDNEKATLGAIAYLTNLHQMFGDWLTALAAYNCGEGRVLRVISGQHINYLDNFWDLYNKLPRETARYVPRFLATIHIVRDPQKYGMVLETNDPANAPFPYGVITTDRSMRLSDIAEKARISEDILHILNAELRLRVTPDREYDLKVPRGTETAVAAVIGDIPPWEPSPVEVQQRTRLVRHKVTRGQTLSSIAGMYGTSVAAIREANKLSPKATLRMDQVLTIPLPEGRAAQAKKAAGSGKQGRYLVQKGDTLSSISRKYNISVQELKKINNLSDANLKAGSTIKVRP